MFFFTIWIFVKLSLLKPKWHMKACLMKYEYWVSFCQLWLQSDKINDNISLIFEKSFSDELTTRPCPDLLVLQHRKILFLMLLVLKASEIEKMNNPFRLVAPACHQQNLFTGFSLVRFPMLFSYWPIILLRWRLI